MFPLGGPLMPGSLLPLQIFEPRYLEMIDRCLVASEPSFGVVMIERGFEVGGGDVRSSVGTLARIVEASPLSGGRVGVVVVGSHRIKVVEWLPDDPFPMAQVADHPDDPDSTEITHDDVAPRFVTLDEVLTLTSRITGQRTERPDLSDLDPMAASFALATLAPFGPADRQRLLCASSTGERLRVFDEVIVDVRDALRFRLSARDEDR